VWISIPPRELSGVFLFHKAGSQVLLSARRFGDVPEGLKKWIPALFYFQLKVFQLKEKMTCGSPEGE
jgi:hypothetical protein